MADQICEIDTGYATVSQGTVELAFRINAFISGNHRETI